jgi:hypothetical protein
MGVQVHVDHVLRAYQGLFSNEARGFFFFWELRISSRLSRNNRSVQMRCDVLVGVGGSRSWSI